MLRRFYRRHHIANAIALGFAIVIAIAFVVVVVVGIIAVASTVILSSLHLRN